MTQFQNNPAQIERTLKRIRRVVRLLDGRWGIPFTRYRFGLDSVIGLIPGAGDVITTAVAAWVVKEAAKLGIPRHVVAQMVANVLIDFVIGSVPVVGDVGDVFFKANARNLDLLERYLNNRDPLDV
jgi:hypothetical protein